MRDERPEERPEAVPSRAERAGDAPDRWSWVERGIWTDRMLDALERGVGGGRWYCLIDKVFNLANLRAAWAKVRANRGAPGVDHETVSAFDRRSEENLLKLHEDLRTGRYQPCAVRRVHIPKPGKVGETRPLGIPAVRDRVVQTALRNVLEPIFEVGFAEHSYGFRPRRGAKDALRRVRQLLDDGYTIVVDADLKSYFDTIPHERLLARVRERVTDGRVLALTEGFLSAGVMDGLETWTPDAGTPQGGVISPLLSNIYLNPLDHQMAQGGWQMVRYADDFVILCRTLEEAERALEAVKDWTANAGLTLHPDKTRLVDLGGEGAFFDFLGYRFQKSRHLVTPKARQRVHDRVRELTPRNSGQSLETVIKRLNATLRGWFEYFKHGPKNVMRDLDQRVRTRLRAILWKRNKRPGFPGPLAKCRWTNAYFEAVGLLSLQATRAAIVSARHAVRPLTGEPYA